MFATENELPELPTYIGDKCCWKQPNCSPVLLFLATLTKLLVVFLLCQWCHYNDPSIFIRSSTRDRKYKMTPRGPGAKTVTDGFRPPQKSLLLTCLCTSISFRSGNFMEPKIVEKRQAFVLIANLNRGNKYLGELAFDQKIPFCKRAKANQVNHYILFYKI